MFFPYGTDAPIYYRPIMTVILIAVNCLVFHLEMLHPESIEPYMLSTGNGIHPTQWLTNNFLHAGLGHLVGNMLGLWGFGLVVEGKLGPLKTLLVYSGIGIFYGAFVQLLFLGADPGHCLGASAVIFGFMAMCLIWAPENLMECVFLLGFRPFFFEMSIKLLVGLFLGLQALVLFLNGGQLSSELLHAVGAAVGFAIGIAMLKWNMVDCENWDVFSVWAGRHTMTDIERARVDAEKPEAKRAKTEEIRKRQNMMQSELRRAVKEEKALSAFALSRRLRLDFPNDLTPEEDILALIQLLSENKHFAESITVMEEYLTHYTRRANLVRLNLAKVLGETGQRLSAIRVLGRVEHHALEPHQLRFLHKLREKLEKTDSQNTYEMDDGRFGSL